VCRTVSYCFAMLRQLRSIRYLVSASVFQSLVTALVLCRLDYGNPVSEMTYTVSSGTLNPSIPYHTWIMVTVRRLVFRSISCLSSTTPPVGPERVRSSIIPTSSLRHHKCTSQFTLVTCAGTHYLQGCRPDVPCSDRRRTAVSAAIRPCH